MWCMKEQWRRQNKTSRDWIFVALAMCGLFLGGHQRTFGDELEDFRHVVLDGVNKNLDSIRSFHAHIVEQQASTFATRGKVLEKREFDRAIVFDIPKWRQQVNTTWVNHADGKTYPYSSDTYFDGDQTLRATPQAHSASIEGGNKMESIPTPDLSFGYTFIEWPIASTLQFAKSIELVDDADSGPNRQLVKVVLYPPEHPKWQTILWLDPQAAYLIVKATGFYDDGRPRSARTDTEVIQAGGAWFLTRGHDELWYYEGEIKKTTLSDSWQISLSKVNEPVDPREFDIKLNPGTLLVNNLTGRNTVVGGVASPMPANRNWPFIITVNALIVCAIAGLYLFIRRRKESA